MESRIRQLERLGIKITLTKQGCGVLSKIMKEGCPVKFYANGDFIPVDCQMEYLSGNYSCKRCWYKWLKNFVIEVDK